MNRLAEVRKPDGPKGRFVEATGGFEPPNRGFADLRSMHAEQGSPSQSVAGRLSEPPESVSKNHENTDPPVEPARFSNPRYGSGSLFRASVRRGEREYRYWAAELTVGGKRIRRTSKTRREALANLVAMRRARGDKYSSNTGVARPASLRPLARDYVKRLLAVARESGWSDEALAGAVVAHLAPKRLKHGIFGPCVYCGTWVANSVDHVVPRSRGGTDEPDNLVSACYACNFDKKARTPEEWQR